MHFAAWKWYLDMIDDEVDLLYRLVNYVSKNKLNVK